MQSILLDEQTDAAWTQLAPLLDEAMVRLGEQDRAALVMRYFENKTTAQVAAALRLSEAAAHKRVQRAVGKLRGFFARRGLVLTTAIIAGAISANSVQAAPAGLAKMVSAVAAGKGAAAASSTLVLMKGALKLMAWTKAKVATVAAALAVAVGIGIYGEYSAAQLRADVETLQQQQPALADQLQQWQRRLSAATNRLAAANEEFSQLQMAQHTGELLKLRGQVGMLRQQLTAMKAEAASRAAGYPKLLNDPATKEAMRQSRLIAFRSMYGPLFKELKLTPEQTERAAQAIGEVVQTQIDKWFVLPQGSLSPAEIAQAGAERETEWERQLQPVLGEAGCARFREYQAGIPAQATVELLNGELGANQLSEDQKARLLQVVRAEPVDLTRGLYGDWDPAFWGPQDYIDDHLLRVAESNQRIVRQAGGFLTPEQLDALSTVLSNGITARITMAAALIRKP